MTLVAGRYALAELLGQGGMARVLAGHDTWLDRPVAVKLLTAVHDPNARARFLREAESASRVHHPAAVEIRDTGEHEGVPFIVMERLVGTTLAERLATEGPPPVGEAVAITVEVLAALDAAHAVGVVHRDVTPANVFLLDDGRVKLADFGIAKALDDADANLTATGSVMGTPAYLAPELVAGGRASPASDLYGVGCLLYAQLAGRPPFQGGGPVRVAYAHRHQAVPTVARDRSDVPRELRRVVHRALAKTPSQRFADAATMRAALLQVPLPERPAATGRGAAAGTPATRDPSAGEGDGGGEDREPWGPSVGGGRRRARRLAWGSLLLAMLAAIWWWETAGGGVPLPAG